MPSLTAHEARTRAADLNVVGYDVALDLTQSESTFFSRTTVEFRTVDGNDTFLDLMPHEVHSVQLNGQQLDPDSVADGRLLLSGLADTNTLEVEATMAYSRDGEGLHRAVDPEDGLAYLYAMTFLPAAPRIFACFDQPDLKAPYRVSVRAPEDWLVVGNGAASQPEPGLWTLAETQPLATYFVTLVAGPYHSVYDDHDGIPLGLHCRQSLARHLDKDAGELFSVTARCLDEYHRLFGIRYPFGEYHQAFVPEFNAGAMENPGCVTFTDEYVFKARATDNLRASRANVVAHEMAHQWFGDLVTMKWWDDLWLNESFAEYMGYRVTSEVTPFRDVWVEFALGRKAWGLAADQRRTTHPVAGNGAADAREALNNFDGISYSKGAAVLRQLNAYLGDESFLTGVKDHLRRHAYGNATFADLIASWERASGRDVSTWADAWLRTAGPDTLSCAVGDSGELVISRRIGSEPPASRPHTITVTAYEATGVCESTPFVVTEETTAVPLPASREYALVVPDSSDETWATIALDERSVRLAPQVLPRVRDDLSRSVVWSALRAAVLDARTAPDDYLDALTNALPQEVDLVVEVLLGSGSSSGALGWVGTFFSRVDQRRGLAAIADRVLADAAPASNRQLIAARGLIAATDDAQLLDQWYCGAVPEGLPFDEDLRWRLLTALCTAGVGKRADVEALRGDDPSSQGALHALRALAALPDAASKEEMWESLTTDVSLSNYELYALAEGFFQPDQVDLTADYVSRYFTDMPGTAAIRSGILAQVGARLAYPRYAVSSDTVQQAEDVLADETLDPGVRRSISDRTDDMQRVLHSRSIFGG